MDKNKNETKRVGLLSPTSLLAFIFFASGFAALMYQVVWQRLLTVHYGVGSISITLIVSIYMVGLGVGALFGGVLAERSTNKITAYFIIELLIGVFGIVSLPLLALIGRHTAGSNYVFSLIYMFGFLCIPTFLMGTTLPLLTKIFNQLINDFLGSVSFLYFINTLGAALGTVFASYVVISLYGLDVAAVLAASINFLLAALIFLLRYSPKVDDPVKTPATEENVGESGFGKVAYLLVFITGFLAIGYEIIWFRVIGVLTKASPYAFSSVLSIYLLAIAVGSYAVNGYLKKHRDVHRKSLFFRIQFWIGISVIGIFLGYFYLTRNTPLRIFTETSFETVLHPSFAMPSFDSFKQFALDLYRLLDVFWWSSVFVFIPALLMGASFPLISLLALTRTDREGSTVGTVYFFNIAGNVLGGFLTGFALLPMFSTEKTLLVFVSIGILFGLFVTRFRGRNVSLLQRAVVTMVLLAITVVVFPGKGDLYETMHDYSRDQFDVYLEEGVEGVVLTCEQGDLVHNYINGLGHGMRPGYEFYYETLEAMSYAPTMDNALVIGFGTGSIVELIQMAGDVGKITLVELNDTLLTNLRKMKVFTNILDDPRLTTILDDGRRYLLRSDEKFCFVTTDPLRSTTSYSNNLYSRQFFQLVEDHLKDDGIFLIWKDEHNVVPNTVNAVFDHVRVYSFFLLASNTPFEKHPTRHQEILNHFTASQQDRLAMIGDGRYVGDQSYIERDLSHYPINEDWKPVTEYYLGMKLRGM